LIENYTDLAHIAASYTVTNDVDELIFQTTTVLI